MRRLEEKLDDVLLAILHEHPFYWSILHNLKRTIIESVNELPGISHAATDGFSEIIYVRETCNELTTEQLIGLTIHECHHVAHFHPQRLEERDKFGWNVATDYAVNDLIYEAGMQLPEGALYEPAYTGMAPEEIYEQLLKEQEQKEQEAQNEQQGEGSGGNSDGEQPPGQGWNTPPDETGGKDTSNQPDQPDDNAGKAGNGEGDPGHDGSGGGEQGSEQSQDQGDRKGEPEPGNSEGTPGTAPNSVGEGREEGTIFTRMKVDWNHGDMMTKLSERWKDMPPEEQEEYREKITAMRQRAVMIAQAAGKDLEVCQVTERAAFTPRDWREHLRSFVMDTVTREDYTWQRPNRRFVSQDIYLPSLRGTNDPESIVLAIDNSGSISQDLLKEFLEEVAGMMVEMPTTLFHIICCDTRVNAHHKVSAADLPLDFEVQARGGTRFTPVFVEVEDQDIKPEALIYFTDMGSSDYPSEPPDYPVLWMNYGSVRPTNKKHEEERIKNVKNEYAKYSYQNQLPNWTEAEWRAYARLHPFGEITNMKPNRRGTY